MPPREPRRGRVLAVAGIVAVLLAIVAGVLYEILKGSTGTIQHRNAPFKPENPARPKPRPQPDLFVWPRYGYTPEHTRYFPDAPLVRPPFHRKWRMSPGGKALLEFPPVIYHGVIYQLADTARVRAVSKRTGKVLWNRAYGHLAASTPAIGAGGRELFISLLERSKGCGCGEVAAIARRSGRVIWSRNLPSRSESSPLYDGGRVYVGSEGGTLYALSARTGHTVWTYGASGAIKGSPTLKDGVLYFGDYGGNVHAVYARSGHLKWSTGTSGAHLGLSAGTFYATAAVEFGRVYIGNTDGREYSFVADTGKLAWAKQTGNYVYSSAAVADVPGLGPTVYFGSYDGTFYALNARTGDTRWSYGAGGKISGSPTIVGNVVYFANLAAHHTVGLDVRSGHQVFEFSDGGFDPVISDGRYLYVTGYSNLYALTPEALIASHRRGVAARHRRHR